ncbi:hypothetical protein J4455_00420 [Candidatus Woesearchaeota archaeon]|nr:hypothetical protein [Candidatus Woesearchaeota archaeon]
MANYFIVEKDNKTLYEGQDQLKAVSFLSEEPSKIHPTSCTYLVELEFPRGTNLVRIVYIRSAYRSNIAPELPSGDDSRREIPSPTLERLIYGWRSTRTK